MDQVLNTNIHKGIFLYRRYDFPSFFTLVLIVVRLWVDLQQENAMYDYFGVILTIFLVVILVIYAANIEECIETLRVRKIAKKLKIKDKGRVAPLLNRTNDFEGNSFYSKTNLKHTFCRKIARVGIFEEKSVHWCATCECIISDPGNDGGDDDTSKDPPNSPDFKKITDDILDKVRKHPV